MSNKPLKASDQKMMNEIMSKKKKKIETLHSLPPYTYIVCEGTKTEPNYISGMVDAINKKYYNYGGGARIIVKGTGRNTLSLLKYARKNVNIDLPEAKIVWLMYDRDDFDKKGQFDNTESSAKEKHDKRKYKVAWSNECIELWFILHFQELNADVGRGQYKDILNKYFDYEKNMTNIYDILKDNTKIAIKRAKKQYKSYEDKTPSKCCPATRVFELVEELEVYL